MLSSSAWVHSYTKNGTFPGEFRSGKGFLPSEMNRDFNLQPLECYFDGGIDGKMDILNFECNPNLE